MRNAVKAKFQSGGKPLGTFFELGSDIAAEALGYAGLDYLIIDTEHGPFDVQATAGFVRAGKFAGTTPFVRVRDSSRASILTMLELGAMGVIIPNIHSVEEARRVVEYGKYHPVGARGIAMTAGTRFWTEDYAQQGLLNVFETANAETLLIPQCETRGALDDIEAIANTDGIDGIFVGPNDLSVALGAPGDFTNPELIDAIQKVADVCRTAGKMSFIYTGSEEQAIERLAAGYDSVAYGMDAVILMDAVRQFIQRIAPSPDARGEGTAPRY